MFEWDNSWTEAGTCCNTSGEIWDETLLDWVACIGFSSILSKCVKVRETAGVADGDAIVTNGMVDIEGLNTSFGFGWPGLEWAC